MGIVGHGPFLREKGIDMLHAAVLRFALLAQSVARPLRGFLGNWEVRPLLSRDGRRRCHGTGVQRR